jgi:hypothetical protein
VTFVVEPIATLVVKSVLPIMVPIVPVLVVPVVSAPKVSILVVLVVPRLVVSLLIVSVVSPEVPGPPSSVVVLVEASSWRIVGRNRWCSLRWRFCCSQSRKRELTRSNRN